MNNMRGENKKLKAPRTGQRKKERKKEKKKGEKRVIIISLGSLVA
jgi:hypothetical protein